MKPVYFLSDAHLGSRGIANPRRQEQLLVQFLDDIKTNVSAIYLLGDMFDFWYEYRLVVPKGFTRFLGKLSELTDRGVDVHFFTGNHDIWCGDYLEKECNVILHREPLLCQIGGKTFYLAHGDGLGPTDWKFRCIRAMFHSHLLQTLFSAIHPRWSVDFGLAWARHSRMKRKGGMETPFQGEEHEPLVLYSRQYLESNPSVDYFIYGHRHIITDIPIGRHARMVILGDWITQFSYAIFDAGHLSVQTYSHAP